MQRENQYHVKVRDLEVLMQRVPESCKAGGSLTLWSESLSRYCREEPFSSMTVELLASSNS